MVVPNKYLAKRKLPPAPKRNAGTAVKTQKTKTDSNTERIRLFYTGRGKGLKPSVSKDAIPADQTGDKVQAP